MVNKLKEIPSPREWKTNRENEHSIVLELSDKGRTPDAVVLLTVREAMGEVRVSMGKLEKKTRVTRREWALLIPILVSSLEKIGGDRITAWIVNKNVGEMMDMMGARSYEEEHSGEKRTYRELTIEQLKNAAQRLSHWV